MALSLRVIAVSLASTIMLLALNLVFYFLLWSTAPKYVFVLLAPLAWFLMVANPLGLRLVVAVPGALTFSGVLINICALSFALIAPLFIWYFLPSLGAGVIFLSSAIVATTYVFLASADAWDELRSGRTLAWSISATALWAAITELCLVLYVLLAVNESGLGGG